jgi:hypothetical protein
MAARAFDRMLPDGWRTDTLAATDRAVELKFVDGAGSEHSVELLPKAPDKGAPDGKGDHFFYRFVRGADSPRDVQVMLWAAGVVDAAVGSDASALTQPAPQTPNPPPPKIEPENGKPVPPPASAAGFGSAELTPPPPPTGMAPFNPRAPSGDGAPIMGPGIPISRTIALYFHSIDQRAVTSRALALLLGLLQALVVVGAIVVAAFPSLLRRAPHQSEVPPQTASKDQLVTTERPPT